MKRSYETNARFMRKSAANVTLFHSPMCAPLSTTDYSFHFYFLRVVSLILRAGDKRTRKPISGQKFRIIHRGQKRRGGARAGKGIAENRVRERNRSRDRVLMFCAVDRAVCDDSGGERSLARRI